MENQTKTDINKLSSSEGESVSEDRTVPYIVHEGILARFERINRRLWVLVVLLIALLVGSNIAWLVYESQYQKTESTTVTQDTKGGDGDNSFVGGDVNGKADSESSKDQS